MRQHPLSGGAAFFSRLLSGARVSGLENLAPGAGQRVYYANHSSHLDFLVVWSSLPITLRCKTRPVAAADYWSKGARRFVAQRIFNAVLLERRPDMETARHIVDQLLDAMGNESSLILFPEGTRGSGERIAEFKSGVYHLCEHKPDLELVPVRLENTNRILPKGEFMPVPVYCRVTFGAPTRLQPHETRRAFLSRLRDALIDIGEESGGAKD